MDPTVQVAAITGGVTLAVALLGILANRRLRRQDEVLERQDEVLATVKDQVKNSHETNLRDDLDAVLRGIRALVEGQERHEKDIAGLREDLRLERRERLAWQDRQSLPY